MNSASPDLIGNVCESNQLNGILFTDESGGSAIGNICIDNTEDIISITKNALPIIID